MVMPAQNDRDTGSNAHTPNHIVRDMYLEVNSISQGLNVGLLVLVIATLDFSHAFATSYFSIPFLVMTNFVISIIFWARYYFDTEILNRSYTLLSVVWFFAYIVSQGVSISLITAPSRWLMSTGVFLFFGSGFYVLNLHEIRRKQRAGVISLQPNYVHWQSQRMIELIILSAMAFGGAYLVTVYPILAFPAASIALVIAIWQLIITNDYRRLKFIETGV